VRLPGATIGGQLSFSGGHFKNPNGFALNAQKIKTQESVFLDEGFNAQGEVNIAAATIGGQLSCIGGQFVNPVGYALNAQSLVTKGPVFFRSGFRAEGEVKLGGATVGGGLDCIGGKFINPNKRAFNADGARVEGNIFLRDGFKAIGEVSLVEATITKQLNCSNAHFANPGGYALSCESLNVKDVLMRDGFKSEGIVSFARTIVDGYFIWTGVDSAEDITLDLRSANIGTLWDDPASWPEKGNLFLDGLVYSKIADDAPIDAKTRINWLHRQPRNKYRPQPYIQLAEVLRLSGHNAEAKNVLIAMEQEKVQLTEMSTFEKGWYWVFGLVLDYGHHLWKAFGLACKVIVVGWFFFGAGAFRGLISPSQEWAYGCVGDRQHDKLKEGYPRLNIFLYSIDAFIPLIDLHQIKFWLPNSERRVWWQCKCKHMKFLRISGGGLLRLYLWIHIFMGWVLTLLFVGGLASLVRT
jgi:hypothetical protein